EGDHVAAIDLFALAIERAPNWPSAQWSLGKARREIGDRAGAAAAFRECLRLDPEDALGASLALAELDAAVTVDAAPAAYVKALFNAYADDFDKALVERLDYSTPQQLADIIRAARGENGRFKRALDLGCGTGLAGEAIVADAIWLEGVDLSDGMIEKAREKGVYDALSAGDIQSALHNATAHYDLILAADVLVYFGELAKVFAAVASRLEQGGLFAFSVEKGAGADWSVHASLRFTHSADYVGRALKAAGLELMRMEESALRKDRGADIIGLLVLARKAVDHDSRYPTANESAPIDAPASFH
ncbi:MAG: methyltransferase domain-containing protein, partial [Parvularculaceae bacterium]